MAELSIYGTLVFSLFGKLPIHALQGVSSERARLKVFLVKGAGPKLTSVSELVFLWVLAQVFHRPSSHPLSPEAKHKWAQFVH